jgi:hypothetical protein
MTAVVSTPDGDAYDVREFLPSDDCGVSVGDHECMSVTAGNAFEEQGLFDRGELAANLEARTHGSITKTRASSATIAASTGMAQPKQPHPA